MRSFSLAAVFVLFCAALRADFTFQQTSQMTGGALFDMMKALGPLAGQAREPQVSTTIVKGNRMARISKNSVNIIDLDKETVTEIDTAKKTYSVVTFAQMKQAMEDAMARAQNARAQNARSKTAAPADNPNVDTSFDVSAKATGQTKTVSGLEAKEMLITMTMQATTQATDANPAQSGAMNIVNDSWMASVPGYDEVKEFYRKMGEKMGYLYGSGMASLGAMRPETLKGFEEVAKEMAKVEGVPVESTMKMLGQGGTGSGGSQASQSSRQNSSNSSPDVGAAAAGAALGRLGLGGFGRSKKNNDPPPQQQPPQGAPGDPPQTPQAGALIEMTTAMSGFSAGPADGSKFEVPAGYKQVESPALKRGR